MVARVMLDMHRSTLHHRTIGAFVAHGLARSNCVVISEAWSGKENVEASGIASAIFR